MAIKFRPVRGTESVIELQTVEDGYVYFATDSGHIYLDTDDGRIAMGGSGISWYYADQAEVAQDINEYYIVHAENVTAESKVRPDDLIINTDGSFYKVLSINSDGDYACSRIAVSGSGGGGGGGPVVTTDDIAVTYDTETINRNFTFIEGKNQFASFTATSETDDYVTLEFALYASAAAYNANEDPIKIVTAEAESGEPYQLNMSQFPAGKNQVLTVVATAMNSKMPEGVKKVIPNITIVTMTIEKYKENSFVGITTENTVGGLTLDYVPYGAGLTCYLHASVDNTEININQVLTNQNMGSRQTVAIPMQSHGMHTIRLWLSTELNNDELTSNTIEFEAAFIDTESTVPVIWTGDYSDTVLQYENAIIPYMVYNPTTEGQGLKTTVTFKKNNVAVTSQEVQYGTNWISFDTTAYYSLGANTFTISCGVASKDVSFIVVENQDIDLNLVNETALVMNFNSLGRSSSEPITSRKTWTSTKGTYSADFNNFNWYNNGWKDDEDGEGSYLSIANDAALSIPFGTIGLNGTSSYTFEMRFRVRNIQKYSTLVTSIPLYKYYTDEASFLADQALIAEGSDPANMNTDGTELSIDEMNEANGNTDLRGPMYWLAYDKYGNPAMNERNTTRKTVETERGVAVKYLNPEGYGFCIGTQEAYFRTPSNTTNVRYKEDEIINISFVISGAQDDQKLYLYLNGILSGAENLNNTNVFEMQNIPFVFNSAYCDFDLYKFRIYRIGLTMPEVIHNYMSDLRDITLYAQNNLTNVNDATKLDFNKLLTYNEEHPEALSMPYAVWKIEDPNFLGDDRLPFIKKGGTRLGSLTFVNPSLDQALENGEITEEFYYTHSPSFTANTVTFDVQGTSSQGYPRRNYKTKFKSAGDTWVFTKGSLAGQSIAQNQTLESGAKVSKKWHMDSASCSTNKFTWKIDYMESSGSYNTGFANLMGLNLYNKHPLNDLFPSQDFSEYRTSVYGYPVLVFHEFADGTYEYIGRYNLNLDKGSNEYYGFESSLEHPYVVDGEGNHPTIADVAQCWELCDNQGTWCSFRFPSGVSDFSPTKSDGGLEVLDHFEYRYNNQEDEIDAAIDQNPIFVKDGKTKDFSEVIGSTVPAMNSWLRGKLAPLERLFQWLDSTDPSKATLETFAEPVGPWSVDRTSNDATITYTEGSTGDITAVFTADTAEYRLQKFKKEFDEHLDKDYCTIYFIMTELLLCYDSRGKNMMMATFGPHRLGGEYIWYPIFYDIDTQLGLNNVGALLWDYNEDASENQTYSTSTSVLWTNFKEMFSGYIKAGYASLRQNKLTYQRIEGAYICDPEVFSTSYAMRGIRPTIAIGLDEYVKYIAPITTGYYDTSGTIQTGSLGDYLYACQGDRKLSRELFIINRLNYMDSKWEAGDYIVENAKQQIYMRVNVNATGTSDIYLDSDSFNGVLPSTARPDQRLADYPVPYLDAQPSFNVTPYLSQYITTFTDESKFTTTEAYDPVKYPNGMPSATTPGRLSEYKMQTKQQEINYLPAGDYLSSLGDLSNQYLDSIGLYHGKRLLDITLGSDHPDYYNDLAGATTGTIWTFGDGIDSSNKKTLLKKVVLTGLRNLSTSVDLRGSEKLQEYRALNTKIPYVTFANGAPLNTVHLPSYTSELYLNGNRNLTRILRDTPVIMTVDNQGVASYADHSSYEGLFIDSITNYQLPTGYSFNDRVAGSGVTLSYIEIADDALNYDSYEILRNTVAQKYGTGQTLKVQMNNVHWSPYTVVAHGESYDSSVTYYKLNDHSYFEEYTEGTAGWDNGTLNEKIYTYDPSANKSTITDLSMFDLFLDDRADAESGGVLNYFRNISKDSVRSYPTITGSIYIDNSAPEAEAIDEDALTNVYGAAWPNLKITAAKINEALLGKFILLEDSGKESEYDVIRYNPNEYHGLPVTLTTKLNPSKGSTFDFLGWATDPEGNNMVFTAEGDMTEYGRNYTFDKVSRTVITLYAIFQDHRFAVTFKNAIDSNSDAVNPNDDVIEVKYAVYGATVTEPADMVVSSLDSSALGLEQIYKFKGYTRLRSNTLVRTTNALRRALVDVSSIPIGEDLTLYACYMLEDVHDAPTDSRYFTVANMDMSEHISQNGYDLRPAVKLRGKVTIPSTFTYNGITKPVVSISQFGDGNINVAGGMDQSEVTHVFFMPDSRLNQIGPGAFNSNKGLEYIELPDTLLYIGSQAFQYVWTLENIMESIPDGVTEIGMYAFAQCFDNENNTNHGTLIIPSTVTKVGNRAFSNNNMPYGTIQFGSPNHPSSLDFAWEYASITTQNNSVFVQNVIKINAINFYYDASVLDPLTDTVGTTGLSYETILTSLVRSNTIGENFTVNFINAYGN